MTRRKWNPDERNSRGGTWGLTPSIKGQSQPDASVEGSNDRGGQGYWDVDDDFGQRKRYDEKGNEITAEQAHGPGQSSNQGNDQTLKYITAGAAFVAGAAILIFVPEVAPLVFALP